MKDKIVEASIELFNEMGTHRVTTNHIIDRLGISPGTFYYHFKNKEEIIRRIFDRITAEFGELFSGSKPETDIKESASVIRNLYSLYYKYRFFYYDISMLLDRDEELAAKYRENYRLKTDRIRILTLSLENQSVLKKFVSDEEREQYIENQWILNDYWLSFRKAAGEPDESGIIEGGVRSCLAYIRPYLTDKAIIEMEELF